MNEISFELDETKDRPVYLLPFLHHKTRYDHNQRTRCLLCGQYNAKASLSQGFLHDIPMFFQVFT